MNAYNERAEILVKCSLCGDIWHTKARIGEGEVCTDCEDVFEIHPQDVVSGKDYKIMLQHALRREEEN